ncbi:MAG TPA: hypothetical protein VNF46_03790 [Gammaproteobacteria bacterium]|nr:hypothetical protein [Gammaproteobacteria bacterium]
MITVRLLPSINPGVQTRTAFGRTYSGTPGQVFDVILGDAAVLEGAGWNRITFSGSTADRPTSTVPATLQPVPLSTGLLYLDTTLGKVIVYDGIAWRDVVTGGVA